jgi:hypothetical protein
MRILGGLGLGLCGLAIAAAPTVKAQDVPAMTADGAMPPAAQVSAHNHNGLFGWRHCVECQRAWVKKHDGVDVPPPPSVLPAGVVPGQATVVGSYPPGHASMGGPGMADAYAPDYAVVGGAGGPALAEGEPAPVGVSRAGQTHWNGQRMAATGARSGPGSYDPSVLPTSTIPAQTALEGSRSGRPHVISHLFGLPRLHRPLHEKHLEQMRAQHASISYDPPAQPVSELPASMVYEKRR